MSGRMNHRQLAPHVQQTLDSGELVPAIAKLALQAEVEGREDLARELDAILGKVAVVYPPPRVEGGAS